MPGVLKSPPASKTPLPIRIAWIWVGVVGIVFLLVGSTKIHMTALEKYFVLGLSVTQLSAAYFLREQRRIGVLLAGCAFAVLSGEVFKTMALPRDALSAIGFLLVMAGVPFVLGLLRWRELT